jgi:hypothetical protein
MNLSQELLDCAGRGIRVGLLPGITPRNRPENELRSNGIAAHVNKTKKVWILEIDFGKGRLVEKRHAHVVERPQQQPNANTVHSHWK